MLSFYICIRGLNEAFLKQKCYCFKVKLGNINILLESLNKQLNESIRKRCQQEIYTLIFFGLHLSLHYHHVHSNTFCVESKLKINVS